MEGIFPLADCLRPQAQVKKLVAPMNTLVAPVK